MLQWHVFPLTIVIYQGRQNQRSPGARLGMPALVWVSVVCTVHQRFSLCLNHYIFISYPVLLFLFDTTLSIL